MAYVPKHLRSGDVILVAGHRLGESVAGVVFDWLIDFATVNPFHHAAIVHDGLLIESLWTVTASPLDKYASTGYAFRPSLSKPVCAAASDWCAGRVGSRYGVKEILVDGARDFLHLPLGFGWRPHLLACSALVAEGYRRAGAPLTRAPVPAPADLSYSPLLLGVRPWEKHQPKDTDITNTKGVLHRA